MLNIFEPKDLNELKVAIKNIWRLNKELLRTIESNHDSIKWKVKNSIIQGIRVSYNDKFVLKLKKRDLKEKERKLKDEIQKEKQAKDNLDKLLKLKPKDYKNISKKEKDETQFVYMYQKSKRECLEKDIEKL